jgi:hypothetical protein
VPTREQLLAANGNPLKLLGEMTLKFSVNGYDTSAHLLVTEQVDGLILGIDWLKENDCTWHIGRNEFLFKGEIPGKMHDRQSKKAIMRLWTRNDVRIPARQVTAVDVWPVDGRGITGTWITEPKAYNQDLLVSGTVLSNTTLKQTVAVVNLTDKERIIKACEVIARAVPAEIEECSPLKEGERVHALEKTFTQ